jgi:hypothetical protein
MELEYWALHVESTPGGKGKGCESPVNAQRSILISKVL